jgi:hypothetical protein
LFHGIDTPSCWHRLFITDFPLRRKQIVGAKAVLKPPHSRRWRDCREASTFAKRLECGAFTAAFGHKRLLLFEGLKREFLKESSPAIFARVKNHLTRLDTMVTLPAWTVI